MTDQDVFKTIDNNGILILTEYIGASEVVIIPDGIDIIGSHAFNEIDNVKSVTVPGSVKRISQLAFSNMNNLENVVLREGVEEIEYGAFLNCNNLKEVYLPDSLKQMTKGSFIQCEKLDIKGFGNALLKSRMNNNVYRVYDDRIVVHSSSVAKEILLPVDPDRFMYYLRFDYMFYEGEKLIAVVHTMGSYDKRFEVDEETLELIGPPISTM